jgi:hypothetical protein
LRSSRSIPLAAVAAAALAAVAAGCAPKVLVVVDPKLCPDGGPVSATTGCVPAGLVDGLVGYWHLDDETGSRIARDSSINGNDGVLAYLDPAAVWVAGKAVGGLAIEGDGFVNVDLSPSIASITDQLTIAGWGFLEGTIMDYATIASREVGTSIDQHYHISINSRGEVPALWLNTEAGTMLLQSTVAVTRQTWIHIAGTYDGTTARLYVDGQPVASQATTGGIVADTTPLILGANGNGASDNNVTERFPGKIDEIMLYRRALTAGEITQIHDGALFAAPRPAPDAGARD